MRRFAIVLVIAGCANDRPPETELVSIVPPNQVRPMAPKPKVSEPPKLDLALAPSIEMRRPIRDGRLTLIPIVATQDQPSAKYVTLEDGMARGLVTVREVGQDFEVDTLSLRNNATLPLLVLEGELVLDGEQDRVMSADLVVPPKTTRLVNVRCVEHD